jgi:hypothetical protein
MAGTPLRWPWRALQLPAANGLAELTKISSCSVRLTRQRASPLPSPLQVDFKTTQHGREINSFSYKGPLAEWAPGDERVHMNAWMFEAKPPPAPVDFVIDCFWFCPAGGGPCLGRQC